jgi:hypothetical protein
MKKIVKIIILIIIASFAAFAFFRWENNKRISQNKSDTPNPAENSKISINNIVSDQPEPIEPAKDIAAAAVQEQSEETSIISNKDIPAKFLLQIPFYSQAPFSNWDKVHEEMCEEASVLNGGLYLLGEKLSKDAFEKKLMAFKKLEESELGDYKSNTISEIKRVADIYFAGKINSKIIASPTIEDIEIEVSAGHPVVVPLAGRDIGNSNFTPPGPVYHMLVIKGYDAQNFITNDVGTRKGESYIYKKEVIMKNLHDWNPQDIHLGAKKVLVLMK